MNPEQAIAYMPSFARTGIGSTMSFALYEPLDLAVRADKRYPKVLPRDENEDIKARCGVEVHALGAIGTDGGRLPRNIKGDDSVSLDELFHVEGSVTLTRNRLIGAGTKGPTKLGSVDGRSNQLLFAIDLSEVFTVSLLRVEGRRGQLEAAAIRLDLPETQAGVLFRFIGNLEKGKMTTENLANLVVTTATSLRLSENLDPDEIGRLRALVSSPWVEDESDLVAHIRHPDDLPSWVTADIDDAPRKPNA